MTQTEISQLQIENLDHLGIVAGIIDRIGLVGRVNERLGTLSYICRVPLTIELARETLTELTSAEFSESRREGYRLYEVAAEYAGIDQRWVVVESEQRAERELDGLERRIEKEKARVQKELNALGRRSFNCEGDARKAAEDLAKRLRYHTVGEITIESAPHYEGPGRPSKDLIPEYSYRLKAELVRDEAQIKRHRRRAGRFILATNELDAEVLDTSEVLESYLDGAEGGAGLQIPEGPHVFHR